MGVRPAGGTAGHRALGHVIADLVESLGGQIILRAWLTANR
jgi:hypothetical protein